MRKLAAIDAEALDAHIERGDTLALLDIRDPVEMERGHVFGATSLPRRRIESHIGLLVRDRGTPIVLVDDASGRAQLAAATLASLGYRDVRWLDGGIDAWRQAGRRVATGANVPSKRFGEAIHHQLAVPSIDATTLRQWQAEGRDVLLCDVRTPGEYRAATIPGSVSAPSFDLVLGAEVFVDREVVVVHCAGRTRSIIGTQTLRDLGFHQAVALENGTMGWRLAGESLENDANRSLPLASSHATHAVMARSRALADAAGVTRIDAAVLEARLADGERNAYAFDVRSARDFESGHIPGTRSVPGGQAIQRTDDVVAVRNAPITLIDDGDARADVSALWLRRMGFPNVSVLDGGLDAWIRGERGLETGKASHSVGGWDATVARVTPVTPRELAATMQSADAPRVIDVDTSLHFNTGHLHGASWLPRGWLEPRIASLVPVLDTPIVVTCEDGRQSTYAAATLGDLGYSRVTVLEGGTHAWRARGLPLDNDRMTPQDDIALPPYARGQQAMRDYLAWEIALVDPPPPPAESPP